MLLHYASKRLYYTLLPFVENKAVELPLDVSALQALLNQNSTLTCTCCGWKGADRKTKKHYMFVAKIAEVELFCPKCNHYLGFISDSI